MDPTARGRFCRRCGQEVLDLAALSPRGARAVLGAASGGRPPCVRFREQPDCRVRTPIAPCSNARTGMVALAAAAAAMVTCEGRFRRRSRAYTRKPRNFATRSAKAAPPVGASHTI